MEVSKSDDGSVTIHLSQEESWDLGSTIRRMSETYIRVSPLMYRIALETAPKSPGLGMTPDGGYKAPRPPLERRDIRTVRTALDPDDEESLPIRHRYGGPGPMH